MRLVARKYIRIPPSHVVLVLAVWEPLASLGHLFAFARTSWVWERGASPAEEARI